MQTTKDKLTALIKRANAASEANKHLSKINARIDAKVVEIKAIAEDATGPAGKLRERLCTQLKALADIQLPIMIELEKLIEEPVSTPVEGGENHG